MKSNLRAPQVVKIGQLYSDCTAATDAEGETYIFFERKKERLIETLVPLHFLNNLNEGIV